MKKETLLEIIIGTIGGLVFSIGMCMWLINEWNMFWGGVLTSILGFIILLCIIPIHMKSHSAKIKEPKIINWMFVFTWTIGVIGALTMGFGMSRIMVGIPSKVDIIIGLITGVIGLLICVLNYPIYAYLKSNKK